MPNDWLVAGLGNPGSRYENTRHNIGFLVADELVSRHGIPGAGSWREKGEALHFSIQLGGHKVHLVKPQSFMNLSGEPVGSLMRFYKLESENLIAVYDEIDIPFCDVRIRKGGGNGGHNGVKSLVRHTGGPEFYRVRLGVGRPENENMDVSDWVLSQFTQEEAARVLDLVSAGADAVECLIREGLKDAQNRFTSKETKKG